MAFRRDDVVKVINRNVVFTVAGFSKGSRVIPDGWLMSESGSFYNPDFCEKYKGATSVLGRTNNN